ncbi:SDR family oxidoreductase [Actinomadura fulvescens]|uniref:SDR family oxidoreductase n=1 Tax=Actinomadura fulvescens TaxID=46160 RepID=A0ABN3Q3I0_9ACTN
MAVLITGATGFLGIRLLGLLLAQQKPIIALTNRQSRTRIEGLQQALRQTGHPEPLVNSADQWVSLIDIELAENRLGLDPDTYNRLASETEEIWHSAACTSLAPRSSRIHRINVDGTRAILALATEAARINAHPPLLRHVSTAFVAGGRRSGVVTEDELTDAFGFVNAYEESKYDAELMVRQWAAARDACAVVLRPSILVSDQPAPGGHAQPLHFMMGLAALAIAALQKGTSARACFRLPSSAAAHINLMQVDHAAELMVSAAAHQTGPGTATFHISHPDEVPLTTVTELVESVLPLDVQLVPEMPDVPTDLERVAYDTITGFLPYAFFHRHYDRTGLRSQGLDRSLAPVTVEYLRRGLTHPNQQPVG